MKKLLIAVMLVALGFAFSCKKGENKEPPAPTPPAPAPVTPPPAEMPAGKVIAPEAFYQFELDRIDLLKGHKNKFLQLLKSAKAKDKALIDKIVEANKSIVTDFIALTQKDSITAPDYNRTLCATTGQGRECKAAEPEAQKADQDFTAKHPEIQQKIKTGQNEVVNIEQQIKTEVDRLKITAEDLQPTAPPPSSTGTNEPSSAPEKEAPAPKAPGK
jgi:hypothetical protein